MELTRPPLYPARRHASRKQSNVNSVMNFGQNHVYNQKRNSMNLPPSPTHDAFLMELICPPFPPCRHTNRKQRNVNQLMNFGQTHFHIITSN